MEIALELLLNLPHLQLLDCVVSDTAAHIYCESTKDKVLNFFQQRITNVTVEGLNNAIRGVIRRSFGFHNFQNLKRRILVELGCSRINLRRTVCHSKNIKPNQ